MRCYCASTTIAGAGVNTPSRTYDCNRNRHHRSGSILVLKFALLAFSGDTSSVNQFQTALAKRPRFRSGARTSISISSSTIIMKSNMIMFVGFLAVAGIDGRSDRTYPTYEKVV
uniref:Uncharacterized protein n=1 Tax=Hyaloperonospora arabidopsidis (strain Emoy2) TaxID=559515 RepID=M4B1I3_HYAAE